MPITIPKCPYCQNYMTPTSTSISYEDGKINTVTVQYGHGGFNHKSQITKTYRIESEEVGETERE